MDANFTEHLQAIANATVMDFVEFGPDGVARLRGNALGHPAIESIKVLRGGGFQISLTDRLPAIGLLSRGV